MLHHVPLADDALFDLLDDGVAGLAKTLLISTLADVLNLSFNRI
ncbi:AAA family ATPase, partial [Corallococcus sp. AB050B]